MYKNEREQEILLHLRQYSYLTVEYLSKKMNVSASSIRRDLADMESRGLVTRSYGGVELTAGGNRTVPFSMRMHENASEKKRIAELAAGLLHNGDVVFLDGSSSAYFVACELVKLKRITVLTNSIESMAFFGDYDIKAYCTGGATLPENRSALVNEIALAAVDRFFADYFFFSAQALLPDGRIFDCYEAEVPLRRRMMQNSAKTVFLCDRTKLSRRSTYYQGNVEEVDCICSDISLRDYFEKTPARPTLLCPSGLSEEEKARRKENFGAGS